MHKKGLCLAAVFMVMVLLAGSGEQGGRIHPALEQKLGKLGPGEKVAVIVELVEQASLSEIVARIPSARPKERARAVVNGLRSLAEQRQGLLRAHLQQEQRSGAVERVIPFWIFNGLAVKASGPLIRNLASRPEVKEVRLDARIPLPSPIPAAEGEGMPNSEWNISLIRAPLVWALSPAYNGTGAVVGSFDTGVDLTHPDLFTRYRGNQQASWFDPYYEHSFPFDANGHGTHTTGIAVGGNASGSFIGVAPGATWIAAKAWDDAGNGVVSAFHQIFEWFLAPGGDPDNAPDVVNCSWGIAESGCDTEFLPDIQALRAAGIFPAFAAGNDGPSSGSVICPGAYPIAFAVGATDEYDGIADFSGRGPSPCNNSTKPNISAPGDGILSSVPWGGYEILSGTSMATPHISGSVAVLRSINPALTVEQLEAALTSGGKDLGEPGPDNEFGAGRLDLFVSAQVAILGPGFPVVKALATQSIATEAGPTPGIFTFSRTGDTDVDLDVRYELSGTATAGSDFVPLAGIVTIPAGSSTVVVEVTPVDDVLQELDETVILKIVSDSAYIVSASDTATIVIKSDELLSDLTISALSAPSAAGAGENIVVTETTKNTGAGTAESSLTQLFLSANTTLDAADLLLGSRSVPALAAGASSSASTTVTIPDYAAGTLYIIAKADAGSIIIETKETNNTSSRIIKIGPDLDITSLSAPATAGAGQSIVVTETTKNIGAGIAGPTLTQFYFSADSAYDPSDVLIGSRSVPALAAGIGSTGSTTVTIPQGTAVGSWVILAKADAEGVVTETSESNNNFAQPIKIGPDLDITTLSAPATAGAGLSIVINETTKNIGGDTAGPSLTRFFLSANSILDPSDALIGNRNVPALEAGVASSGATTVTIPAGTAIGVWYIIAGADSEGVVTEISETNNTSFQSIKLGPDLGIASLSAPTQASAGQSIVVTETTKNSGGDGAGPTLTLLYLSANSAYDASDVLVGSRSIPALIAGATSSGSTTVMIPQETTAGTWFILARADGEGVVAETSETNNVSSRSIKIGPDLDITSFSAPATAIAGQSIVIAETIKNIGAGIAGASKTLFYLSADGGIDASDVLLGSRSVPALAAGISSSGSTTVLIPSSTSAGTWYLIGKADGEGVVPETSESNNTYVKSIKINLN